MNTTASTGAAELSPKPNSAAPDNSASTGEAGKRGRRSDRAAGEASGRFFLIRKDAGPGNTPALGQEFSSEGEAMVEAFKAGATYLRVEEFKPVADFSGGMPALKKEPVSRK